MPGSMRDADFAVRSQICQQAHLKTVLPEWAVGIEHELRIRPLKDAGVCVDIPDQACHHEVARDLAALWERCDSAPQQSSATWTGL